MIKPPKAAYGLFRALRSLLRSGRREHQPDVQRPTIPRSYNSITAKGVSHEGNIYPDPSS